MNRKFNNIHSGIRVDGQSNQTLECMPEPQVQNHHSDKKICRATLPLVSRIQGGCGLHHATRQQCCGAHRQNLKSKLQGGESRELASKTRGLHRVLRQQGCGKPKPTRWKSFLYNRLTSMWNASRQHQPAIQER